MKRFAFAVQSSFALVLFFMEFAGQAQPRFLINVDTDGGSATLKIGRAAIGQSDSDFWNFYTRDDGNGGWRTAGALTHLKYADGGTSSVGLTVLNAPGAWNNGSPDPMLAGYIYPLNRKEAILNITNLPAGFYDFIIYGTDARYSVTVDGVDYGTKATPNIPIANPVSWQEGVQYVVLSNVQVAAEQTATITVRAGIGGYAIISGLQIREGVAGPAGLAPVITMGPAPATVNAGTNFSLSVLASGTSPFTYQWFFNGAAIEGATGYRLNLVSAQTNNSGFYRVAVSNDFGWALSSNVLVEVRHLTPVVVTNPEPQTVAAGSNAVFSVTANGAPVLKYQWLRDGAPLFGATRSSLLLGQVQHSQEGNYSARVWNSYGAVTSATASLTVISVRPSILEQPVSQTVEAGSNVMFTARVAGSMPMFYLWRRNGVPLPEATSTALTLQNVQTNQAGVYSFVVTNSAGQAVSEDAVLTVLQVPHAPVAWEQSVFTSAGEAVDFTLLASDADGDPLTFTVTSPPSHGTLTGTTPVLSYTPNDGFVGTDTLKFKASDGALESEALVTIHVLSDAHRFLISIDIGGAASSGKSGPAAVGHGPDDLWNYYTRNDGNGGWLSFGVLSNLKTVEGTNTRSGMTIANAPGSWGCGSSDDMYNSYNYPFDGGNVSISLTNLGAGVYDFYLYGIGSKYELSAGGVTYGMQSLPNGPVVNPVQWREGLQYVVFREVKVDAGESANVVVRPGSGGYATIAGIQIAAATTGNHAPVAESQSVLVGRNSEKAVVLNGSDVDGDALTFAIAQQPEHGTLSGTPPELTYVPAPDYVGGDSFTFTVNDGTTNSAPTAVSITVFGAIADSLISIDIGGTDTTTKVGPAAIGRGTNDFWNFYTRNDGYGGWLSFGMLRNLKTVDGIGTDAAMTIANAPGAWGNGSSDEMYNSYDYPFDGGNVAITFTNLEAGVYDLYVYGIDSRYELSAGGLSYGAKSLPGGPVVNPVEWQEGLQYVVFRNVQVTPAISVDVTVRPGAGGYATIAGFQIAGTGTNNHPPTALSQTVLVSKNGSKAITLDGSDLDGDEIQFTIRSQPAHGVLVGAPPVVTYTPQVDYTGSDSFSFSVSDGVMESSLATVNITVAADSAGQLISIDVGGGPATQKSGPAAIGHSAADFWNFYSRDGSSGQWLTFGMLNNLKTVEGILTGAAMTIANAPGAWACGSSDPMYNSYDYPFGGGNVTMMFTNMAVGTYDFYVYGIDANYELVAGGQSYGLKSLPGWPVVNPVQWQEGIQYVVFRSVQINTGTAVKITVRPGPSGYANIAGLQILGGAGGNNPPIPHGQTVLVSQGGAKGITLTGSDLDNDPLIYTLSTQPSHGTLEGEPPSLTYTPDPVYLGSDSFSFTVNDGKVESAPAIVSISVFGQTDEQLISIDVGGGSSTGKTGPAAVGHGPADFWNYYTRNGLNGEWLTFGILPELKTVEGTTTPIGMTIANAPGAWGNGSSDEMYNTYNYPFDGGNVVLEVTNLSAGVYDFYLYGIDSHYELSVGGVSYGTKSLRGGPVVNPVAWQEGVQYVAFRGLEVAAEAIVRIMIRPGSDGYATISGLQIGRRGAEQQQAALGIPVMFAASVATLAPAISSDSQVKLRGQIDPYGLPTTVWFEWGREGKYNNSTQVEFIPEGSSRSMLGLTIEGLERGASYSARLRAEGPLGESVADGLSFVMPHGPQLRARFEKPGTVIIAFDGRPGRSYTVEASEDMKSWVSLGEPEEEMDGSLMIEDHDAAKRRARFYRVVER